MTILGCYTEAKYYEFLEQESLHQGVCVGRELTIDEDSGFSLEYGRFNGLYDHIYTARR